MINLYYLLKKLRFNRTACRRTVRKRLSSCRKMPDFIVQFSGSNYTSVKTYMYCNATTSRTLMSCSMYARDTMMHNRSNFSFMRKLVEVAVVFIKKVLYSSNNVLRCMAKHFLYQMSSAFCVPRLALLPIEFMLPPSVRCVVLCI